MKILGLFLVLVASMETVRGDWDVPRVQMIQRQSCYYEPHNKMLTCRCNNHETSTYLELRLMFFMKEKGQQVGGKSSYFLFLNYLHNIPLIDDIPINYSERLLNIEMLPAANSPDTTTPASHISPRSPHLCFLLSKSVNVNSKLTSRHL